MERIEKNRVSLYHPNSLKKPLTIRLVLYYVIYVNSYFYCICSVHLAVSLFTSPRRGESSLLICSGMIMPSVIWSALVQ